MRSLRIAFVILLTAAAAGQSVPPPGADLQVLVSVQHDGSAIGIEHLQLPGRMLVPLRWRVRTVITTPLGVTRRWYVDLLEVTDGHETKLRYSLRQFRDYVEVEIPPQPLALNIARISYSVRNGVQFGDEHDELFWKVANTWNMPLAAIGGAVMVPPAAVGQFTARAFPSEQTRTLTIEGRSLSWASENGSQLPVLDVVFPHGILRQPNLLLRTGWFVDANPIIFLPLLALLVMLIFRRWADRNAQTTVVVRYEPPADLTPAEAGYLIDGSLDPRDIAATLLDLAVRGYLKIEECKTDDEVEYAGQDFLLRLLKPMGPAWAGLKPYEESTLFHIFYGGQWTKLSSVSLRFYSVVPSLQTQIRMVLDRKGLYVDPHHAHAQRQIPLFVIALLLWMLQAVGLIPVAQTATLGFVCIAASVLIVFLFTRGLSHRTGSGSRVFADLRGFQEFLDTVDADRMERLPAGSFEKFLPYAVALGVEHHWAENFSHIATGTPEWFEGKEPNNWVGLLQSVGWFARAAGSVMRHAPRGAASSPRPPAPPPHSRSATASSSAGGA